MYMAIVTICTMLGTTECTDFYNPQLFNKTEEICVDEATAFIEHVQRNIPYPVMVSYRCEYSPGA